MDPYFFKFVNSPVDFVVYYDSKTQSVDCHGYVNPLDLVLQPDKSNPGDAPVPKPTSPTPSKQESTEKQQALQSPTEKKTLNRTLTQPPGTIEYLVKASDTLAGIAARFDTTPGELTILNRLTSRLIFPGQTLYVPIKKLKGELSEDLADSVQDSDIITEEDKKILSQPCPKPGHVERVSSPPPTSPSGNTIGEKPSIDVEPPAKPETHPDQECLEMFLKIRSRHITDGKGVVSGTLLVTPNNLMFIPNVSDVLVIEHGTECYEVTAPMEMVVAAALYYDIAHMRVKHVDLSQEHIPKPEVYHTRLEDGQKRQEIQEKDIPVLKTSDSVDKVPNLKTETEETVVKTADLLSEADEMVVEKTELSSRSDETVVRTAELHSESASSTDLNEASSKEFPKDVTVSEEQSMASKDSITESEKPDKTAEKTGEVLASNTTDLLQPDLLLKSPQTEAPKQSEKEVICQPFEQQEQQQNQELNKSASATLGAATVPLTIDTSHRTSPVPPGKLFELHENLSPPQSAPPNISSLTKESESKDASCGGNSAEDSLDVALREKKNTENKHEKVLKRLSYPMESLTSYTQSFSKMITSSPKSFVDFSSGIFVRGSEEGSKDEKLLSSLDKTSQEGVKTPSQEKLPDSTTMQPTREHGNANVWLKNMVEEKPELFAALDKLIPRPAQPVEAPPLYLCLRMGQPINKKVKCPAVMSGKRKMKSEYWFGIPRDRVDELYKFFQRWAPALYRDVDSVKLEEKGFLPISSDDEDSDKEAVASESEDQSSNKLTNGDKSSRRGPLRFFKIFDGSSAPGNISMTDWEVVSMAEANKSSVLDIIEIPLPEMLHPSEIITEEHRREMCKKLPARAEGYAWSLIYSTSKHGFSLKTLYREMLKYETPVLIAVLDTDGVVFGAMASCSIKMSDHFYGTGESFLFTFNPEFKCYNWTGENMYFVKGNADSLAFGSGEGQFGLWLDGDLFHGRSRKCKTFGNEVLSKNEDFVVKALEAWGFV